MRTASLRLLSALLATMACAGCVAHPVGPARTLGKYTGKAATTAKSALSQVETVRLTATVADRGDATSAFVATVVSDAEGALDGLSGTFGSIQPPDDRGDQLRTELTALLSEALDHVATVRIAARRGTLTGLRRIAEPLDGDADALRRFLEAHQT